MHWLCAHLFHPWMHSFLTRGWFWPSVASELLSLWLPNYFSERKILPEDQKLGGEKVLIISPGLLPSFSTCVSLRAASAGKPSPMDLAPTGPTGTLFLPSTPSASGLVMGFWSCSSLVTQHLLFVLYPSLYFCNCSFIKVSIFCQNPDWYSDSTVLTLLPILFWRWGNMWSWDKMPNGFWSFKGTQFSLTKTLIF